jgi:hypothetical protein
MKEREVVVVYKVFGEEKEVMEKRNLGDLWSTSRYTRMPRHMLHNHGLDGRCHIRGAEDRDKRCLVYVVRRSKPSQGFDVGNFAIDKFTLDWLLTQQGDGSRRAPGSVDIAYVALVEDYNGEIVNHETVKKVKTALNGIEPYASDSGGFYWVNDNFQTRATRDVFMTEDTFIKIV